jgi:hypothetical protein
MNDTKSAAEFILTVPPLEEITDTFLDVTERFRYDMMSMNEAVEELISCYQNELNTFVENNSRINEECLYCIT